MYIKNCILLLEFTVLLTTIICRGEKKIKILHKVCEKAIVHDLSSKNIRASSTKKKKLSTRIEKSECISDAATAAGEIMGVERGRRRGGMHIFASLFSPCLMYQLSRPQQT